MSCITIKNTVKDILSKYLEVNNLRKTKERFDILHEIFCIDNHLTVDLLFNLMHQKGYNISRATIYNNIEILKDCGLIRQLDFSDNTYYFEKSNTFNNHDHIIIKDTNEIIEFKDLKLNELKKSLEEKYNIDIFNHSLYFYAKRKK